MKIPSLIFLILITSFAPAFSQTKSNWEEDKEKIKTYLETENCADLWDTLWSWAQQDHNEAQTLLWAAMYERGIIPPGRTTRASLLLALTVHMMQKGVWKTEDIDILSSWTPAEKKPLLSEINVCVGNDLSRQSLCLNKSVEAGLTQGFTIFIRDINQAIEKGENAVCLYSGTYNTYQEQDTITVKEQPY